MSDNDKFFDKVGSKTARRPGGDGMALRSTPHPNAPQPASTIGENETKQRTEGACKWAMQHDFFWGATQTHDRLPPGLYKCDISNQGPTLVRQAVNTDDLLELPDDATSEIIAEFEKFWSLEPQFRARGFLHKRGYLLYGPPGSGKTSAICILTARLIKDYDGVVLLIDHPQTAAACLSLARKIEPSRPMIGIMEDLDALVQKYGENEYLAMLDGEMQVNGICFLASSNYPEYLDRRFVDRPSRFDTIREIPMPSPAARKLYLQTKEPSLSESELDLWVRLTDDFSVAHLKELIIAVKCLEQPLKVAVLRLQQMRACKPSSHGDNRSGFVRFGNGNWDNGHADVDLPE